MSKSGCFRLTLGRRGDRLFEHEVGQLADAVVLLGRGDELGRRDRAFLGVGPARQRFGADDPARLQVELGLIGDPDLALVDGVVELAEHRQLPRGVLERSPDRNIST